MANVLCDGLPPEFMSLLNYSCSLAFAERPDYEYLHLLLHNCEFNVLPSATAMGDSLKLCGGHEQPPPPLNIMHQQIPTGISWPIERQKHDVHHHDIKRQSSFLAL
ncbi:hypothetical protein JVU11DRAFT_9463 [Chiua virens]|nr:hypothetical protein JVU11DRAFT_9463 [Chiua virens]